MTATPLCGVVVGVAAFAAAVPAQVTISLPASKDNTLYEDAAGALSNGSGSRMFCGNTRLGFIRRALIAFDLRAIPSCATIVSARLTVTLARTRAASALVSLHTTLADWGEGGSMALLGQGFGGLAVRGDATWTHAFSASVPWTSPGGDFDPVPAATAFAAVTGRHSFSSGGLVADVQGWLDDPSTNFGWVLRTTEIGTFTARSYYTREAANPADRPTLDITYTAAAVATVGAGCQGSGATPFVAVARGLPTMPNPGFAIDFQGGPPRLGEAILLTFGTLPVPFPYGWPGCFLYVNTSPFGVVLPGGGGTVPLPIADFGASIECVTFDVQGLGIDANTLFTISTNALTLTLGR